MTKPDSPQSRRNIPPRDCSTLAVHSRRELPANAGAALIALAIVRLIERRERQRAKRAEQLRLEVEA